jgi:general secretion pathway protein D
MKKFLYFVLGLAVSVSLFFVVRKVGSSPAPDSGSSPSSAHAKDAAGKEVVPDSSAFYQFRFLRSAELKSIGNLSQNVKTGVLDSGVLLVGASNSVNQLRGSIALADIPRRQINVDAKLIDISTEGLESSSVEWLLDTLASSTDQLAVEFDNGLNVGFVLGDISLAYSILTESSRCRVDSNPVLCCSEGESASIEFGEKRPIVTDVSTSDSGTTSSTYEYLTIGQGLSILPYCGVSNTVQLAIVQTSDEVSGSTLIDDNEVPIISSRELKTTVLVESGEAVVLGGLKKKVTEETTYSVPLLSSVPLVGRLFRSTSTEEREVELCLMLKPSVR